MIRILCWSLTAVSLLSLGAYGFFDYTWWVIPETGPSAREVIIAFYHLGAAAAGPIHQSWTSTT